MLGPYLPLLALALALSFSLPFTSAFNFNTSTPTQCSNFTVQWDGGTEPFYLVLVPTIQVNEGRILNVTIPTGLARPYSYTFQLGEPSGLEFLATMYDSTGFGSGGTTPVLTVGSSSDTSCLTNNLLYDFYFSTIPTSNPDQCSSMPVSWNNNVSLPVHLYGLVPSGTAFSVPVPEGGTYNTDWTVNIKQNTQFLLFMADSGPYQTGGSTGLFTVGSGSSSSCLNSSSPSTGTGSGTGSASSTAPSSSASTSAVTGVGGTSSGGSSSSSSSSSGSTTDTGAIVGGTVGGVAFIVLLGLLLFCCIRKRAGGGRRRGKDTGADPAIKSYGVAGAGLAEKEKRRPTRNPLDLLGARRRSSDEETAAEDDSPGAGQGVNVRGPQYEPSPFRYPSPPETGDALSSPTGLGLGGRPGAAVPGVSGVLAGASEKIARERNQPVPPSPIFAQSNRPSVESQRTGHTTNSTSQPVSTSTGTGTSTTGTGQTGYGAGGQPPSAWGGTIANADASDLATVGHGSARQSSIRKPPSMEQIVPTPRQGRERPLPVPGAQEREPRFVQHEDSGEIVELPPRYDMLRTRNPDQQ